MFEECGLSAARGSGFDDDYCMIEYEIRGQYKPQCRVRSHTPVSGSIEYVVRGMKAQPQKHHSTDVVLASHYLHYSNA